MATTTPPLTIPNPMIRNPQSQGTAATDPAVAGGSTSLPIMPSLPLKFGLDGYCPVELVENERWVQGDASCGARHEGRVYLFTTPDHRTKFMTNPNRYAPAMAGMDVVALVDSNHWVAGWRAYGFFYENRTYLFSNEESLKKFDADPKRYIEAAEQIRARLAQAAGANGAPLRRF